MRTWCCSRRSGRVWRQQVQGKAAPNMFVMYVLRSWQVQQYTGTIKPGTKLYAYGLGAFNLLRMIRVLFKSDTRTINGGVVLCVHLMLPICIRMNAQYLHARQTRVRFWDHTVVVSYHTSCMCCCYCCCGLRCYGGGGGGMIPKRRRVRSVFARTSCRPFLALSRSHHAFINSTLL